MAVEVATGPCPCPCPDHHVFAQDYADNPPSIANDTYVEIKGAITAASPGYSTLSGGFLGYVPQVRVSVMRRISVKAALAMGMPAR